MNFMTASVEVKVDDSPLQRQLPATRNMVTREVAAMQKQFDSFSFRKAALALAGFITSIAGMTWKVVQVSATAERIDDKFATMFGHMSAQGEEWSNSFASQVGRARMDVKNWMADLQTALAPLGFTRQQGLELSKSLTQAALDIAALQDKIDVEVLENFKSGIIGNVRAVRQYGITITEAAMKQEALNMGISRSLSSMSEHERAQIRANIILRASSFAQGDLYRSLDAVASQVKRLEANYTNLKKSIGDYLYPVFNELLHQFNEYLQVNEKIIAQNIGEFLKNTITGFVNFAKCIKDNAEAIKIFAEVLVGLWIIVKLHAAFHAAKIVILAFIGSLNSAIIAVGGLTGAIALLGIGLAAISVGYLISQFYELNDVNKAVNATIERQNQLQASAASRVHAYEVAEASRLAEAKAAHEGLVKLMYEEVEIGQKRIDINVDPSRAEEQLQLMIEDFQKLRTQWMQARSEMIMAPDENLDEAKDKVLGTYKEMMEAQQKLIDKNREWQQSMIDSRMELYRGLRGYDSQYAAAYKANLEMQANAFRAKGFSDTDIMAWQTQKMQEFAEENDLWTKHFSEAADRMEYSISDSLMGVMQGTQSLGSAWKNVMRGMVTACQQAVADIIAEWIKMQIIKPLMMGMMNSIGGGLFGGFAQGIGSAVGGMFSSGLSSNINVAAQQANAWMMAPLMHKGGLVGYSSSDSKLVSMSSFIGAPRFHSGLGPDEVPAILQKGEQVIPKDEVGQTDVIQPLVLSFNVNSIDTQSGVEFILQHQDAISKVIQKAMRSNHPVRRTMH